MITGDKIKQVEKNAKEWVTRRRNQGRPEEGYSTEDIETVFKPHRYDMRSWYFVFAIIFLLVGSWLFLKNNKDSF